MNPGWKSDLKGRIGARTTERKKSSRSKPIVLVDVLNNTALLFYTVSDMSRYLGRKAEGWPSVGGLPEASEA